MLEPHPGWGSCRGWSDAVTGAGLVVAERDSLTRDLMQARRTFDTKRLQASLLRPDMDLSCPAVII